MIRLTSIAAVSAVVVFAAAILVAIADDTPQAESPEQAPAAPTADMVAQAEIEAAAEASIRRALETRISREFKDTPLKEVVKLLAGDGQFPLIIDEPTLVEEGIASDEPINGRFREATIGQALDRILDPLGLTWLIEDEVLKIATETSAEDRRVTRIYNVRKLLTAGRASMVVTQVTCSAIGRIGGSGCDAGPDKWLIPLIEESTAGPWSNRDGVGGTQTLIRDLLVVRQTQQSHDEIAAVLAALETFVDGKLAGNAIALARWGFQSQDAACYRALREKVSVQFRDTPLKDAIAHIETLIGVQFVLDRPSLIEEGIADDEPINVILDEVTAASVLKIMLEPLGCTFLVEGGVIRFTTQILAEDKRVIYLYDVRDLAAMGLDEAGYIGMLQQETSGPWQDIDGVGGTIGRSLPGALVISQRQQVHTEVAVLLDQLRKKAAEAAVTEGEADDAALNRVVIQFYSAQNRDEAADLQTALTTFVAPETWQAVAGQATIRVVGQTLAIRQTVRVHRQIAEFIRDLEAARDSSGL